MNGSADVGSVKPNVTADVDSIEANATANVGSLEANGSANDGSTNGGYKWLEEARCKAIVYSEAYRIRLVGRIWWANWFLVVLPAVFTTAAALLAAGSDGNHKPVDQAIMRLVDAMSDWPRMAILTRMVLEVSMPTWAAILAGAAAVLAAIHKSLKCDEYQAECLRLKQAYQSFEISADIALSNPEKNAELIKELERRLKDLMESDTAPLPDKFIKEAEKLTGHNRYQNPSPGS